MQENFFFLISAHSFKFNTLDYYNYTVGLFNKMLTTNDCYKNIIIKMMTKV